MSLGTFKLRVLFVLVSKLCQNNIGRLIAGLGTASHFLNVATHKDLDLPIFGCSRQKESLQVRTKEFQHLPRMFIICIICVLFYSGN